MQLTHRALALTALVVASAASQATIVTLSFGGFSVGSGLGQGLFVKQGSGNTFAGEIIASGNGTDNKFYCLSPDRPLNLPSTQRFQKTLVKSYTEGASTIYAGSAMANLSTTGNVGRASRQLGLWLAAGKVVADYSVWNGTTVLNLSSAITPANAYVASGAYTTLNTSTAKEFWLYEPVDSNDKVITSIQSLASEAVPEPMTLALGAAGLVGAVRRRRSRRA